MIQLETSKQHEPQTKNVDETRQSPLSCYDELPPEISKKAILTVQETADFLRVHRTTVSVYAKSGELKSHKMGGRRLFKAVDVWLFFENQVATECVSEKEDC